MMKRIKRFGIFQTAKVIAVIYLLLGVVIFVPLGLMISLAGLEEFSPFPFMSGFALFFIPIIYAAIGFVVAVIGCWVYNFTSQWTGGIALEIETEEEVY